MPREVKGRNKELWLVVSEEERLVHSRVMLAQISEIGKELCGARATAEDSPVDVNYVKGLIQWINEKLYDLWFLSEPHVPQGWPREIQSLQDLVTIIGEPPAELCSILEQIFPAPVSVVM